MDNTKAGFAASSRTRTAFLLASAVSVVTASVVMATNVLAQDKYPSKSLTIVVPFGPGSSSDTSVRLLVSKMQPRFGQPLLVENRPGGGATIGPAYAAKAKPDGYTIVYGSNSSIATAPGMIKALAYDPVRDLSGITLIGEQHFALLTRGEFKDLSFAQFLERMRRNPDGFAIAGQSAVYQILNKMLTEAAKLSHVYVPYAEAGRMLNDLWGGRLGGALLPVNLALPTLRSGQGHIAALTSTTRMASLPNTSTMEEMFPGVSVGGWTGYFAPAKTPRPVINALHSQITEAYRDPEILKRSEEGGRAIFLTPDETDAFVKKEVQKWTTLLKAAGIEPE